jgi:hypothetical protein
MLLVLRVFRLAKYFIPLVFLGMYFPVASQPNEYIFDSFSGSDVLGVFEIGKRTIVVVSTGLNDAAHGVQDYDLVFYEMFLQSEGIIKLEEVQRIDLDVGAQVFTIDYIPETEEWIWVQKMDLGLEHLEYQISVYTNSFDLILNRSVVATGRPIYFHIDTYNGKTCILGSILKAFDDKIFYAEYVHHSAEGIQSILIGQSSPDKMFWITDMRLDRNNGHMLVFYYNGIAVLDSALWQVNNYDLFSGIATQDHGNVLGWGENFFSHGARDSAWDDGRRKMVIHKYDSDFQVLKADTIGWVLQDNYPSIVKSLDMHEGVLMVGGHLDGPFNSSDFHGNVKYFYLAKYNTDLDRLWYKEYGGDKAYTINGLKLLSDETGVAYGFVTDTITGYRYGYLMYVDENGDIISSQEIMPAIGPPLTVVNPGADQLTILNPTALQTRIIVSSLDGREILNTTFQSETVSYDMHDLPSGMYPYVFYIDDRPVKSGKWVKK